MHRECRVVMKPTLAFLTGGTIGFPNVNLWCFHHPHSKDRRRLDIDPTLSVGSISKRHRSDSLCYLGSDGDKVGIMTTLGFHCVLGCLICPVFVYLSPHSAAYMRRWIKSALVQKWFKCLRNGGHFVQGPVIWVYSATCPTLQVRTGAKINGTVCMHSKEIARYLHRPCVNGIIYS